MKWTHTHPDKTERETYTHINTERDTYRERKKDTENRYTQREMHRDTHTLKREEREREADTHTERNRHTQRESKRDRDGGRRDRETDTNILNPSRGLSMNERPHLGKPHGFFFSPVSTRERF